jgi:Domain of unknown function (DUF1843)
MSEAKYSGQGLRALYAVTIHHCAAGGNLSEMKKVAAEAEEHVPTAMSALRSKH